MTLAKFEYSVLTFLPGNVRVKLTLYQEKDLLRHGHAYSVTKMTVCISAKSQ